MAKEEEKKGFKLIQKNKKAYFNYEIIEELECGMSLVGTEVKSVRDGRCSFGDSYINIKSDQLQLIGFTIQPYSHGGKVFNHVGDRVRYLLAHKEEIKKFARKVDSKGMTIVPLEIYIKGNLVKMKIALARGKATYDKKAAIKERDLKREAGRELRNMNF
ncbi:MAG: SsrA-binding protein SmpB [Spirochaetales bacterium]|nr:SsrA-binding protein SmpB [Spirochaetales bacterium]